MQLNFDLNVGSLYIKLSDDPVGRTREIDDNTAVDLGTSNDLVGIEVISVAHPWPLAEILTKYQLPPGEERQLRAYFFARPAPGVWEQVQQPVEIGIAPPAPALVG